MVRMQWWMRPGPRRPCAILEPAPFAQQNVLGGHADVDHLDFHVAVRRIVITEHRQVAQDVHGRGWSIGIRICDCCEWRWESGLVLPIRIADLATRIAKAGMTTTCAR